MPTRRQLIQKIELNSDASSVTFSNIPQNYTDLKLVYSIRNTNTNNYQTMNFNGSTSNFSQRELQGDGSSAGSGSRTDSLIRASVVPSNFTASTFSNTQIYIPNYTSSLYKSFNVKTIVENNSTTGYTWMISGLWSNTSTISSIGITSSMAAGSSIYLYGITHVPIIRGGEVSVRDGFKYHTFKSSGSLQVVEPGNVEYLIAAGGGGGGSGGGAGGGGAGGVVTGKCKVQPQKYTITIGAGGTRGNNSNGGDGNNSLFGEIVSAIGGGGGSSNVGGGGGRSGGSGGGGGGTNKTGGSSTQTSPGAGIGYGNAGGGTSGSNAGAAAGGGGAGAAATTGTRDASSGGNGVTIWGVTLGGGGGGYGGNSNGSGGSGGGEPGAGSTNGGTNLGGGGGGRQDTISTGSTGGSGIVIIRYPYDGN